MFQKELIGNNLEVTEMEIIVNKKIKNEYIIGTMELQALKKLLQNKLITEEKYNFLKNKIKKEHHIFL